MSRVVLLSLTASLNPTLLAATTLMMLLPRPAKLMLGYLGGALLTSITLGLVIVFSLSSSSAAKTTQHTVNPGVDIALGAMALLLAQVIASGGVQRLSERRKERRKDKPPPRWQRELSKGAPRTTFVIGALLTLPGASYLAGLYSIHQLNYSDAATVLLVLGFNLVMLWLLEVPLLGFVLAPERTQQRIDTARAWVSQHARTFAIAGLRIVGALLVLKGVVGLVS